MNFIGVDLHEKSITVCVMDQNRKVLARKTIDCKQTDEIVEFFRLFRPFQVVVEATASHPWFVKLVEPLADRVVLGNPKKLWVIADPPLTTPLSYDGFDRHFIREANRRRTVRCVVLAPCSHPAWPAGRPCAGRQVYVSSSTTGLPESRQGAQRTM
jgi:hypothetical protein